jgi:hypothetical protein
MKREIWAIDRNQPIADVMPMEQLIAGKLVAREVAVNLVGTFAGLALLLAALGVYGLLAYSVVQRRREIGVRMALVAQPGQMLRAILGQGLQLVAAGVILGAAGSWFVMRDCEVCFMVSRRQMFGFLPDRQRSYYRPPRLTPWSR